MYEYEGWKKRLDAQIAWDVKFEAREWVSKIPYMTLPNDVEFKAIPPFGGANCRFMVKKGERTVSVYLDCYNSLGAMDEPYWEMFPYYGDTYRCYLKDVDLLSQKISEELNRELNEDEDEHVWE
jgi:hypothetical protein